MYLIKEFFLSAYYSWLRIHWERKIVSLNCLLSYLLLAQEMIYGPRLILSSFSGKDGECSECKLDGRV